MSPTKSNSVYDKEMEYVAQHFNFTPKAFSDNFYNVLVESWTKVMDVVIVPELEPQNAANLELATRTKMRKSLLSVLFHRDLINSLLSRFENYLSKFVFRIPSHVTLPVNEVNFRERAFTVENVLELETRNEILEKEILKARLVRKMVADESANVEKAIEILEAFDNPLC